MLSAPIVVTEETIYATTRAVVAKNPDHVYKPPADGFCKYVHGNVCGCVVGHVAHELGVPLAELEKHEGKSAHEIMRTFFAIRGNKRRAEGFLNEIQEQQDSGVPWADALHHAERYAPVKVVL